MRQICGTGIDDADMKQRYGRDVARIYMRQICVRDRAQMWH